MGSRQQLDITAQKPGNNKYQWCEYIAIGGTESSECVDNDSWLGEKNWLCGYFDRFQPWKSYRYGTFEFARSRAHDACIVNFNKHRSKIKSAVENQYNSRSWSRWPADKLDSYPFCRCPFKPPPTTTPKPTPKPTTTPPPITENPPAETEKDNTKTATPKPTQAGSETRPDRYTQRTFPTHPSWPGAPSPPDPPGAPGDKSESDADLTKTVEEDDDKIVTTWKNENGRVVKEKTTLKKVPGNKAGSTDRSQTESKPKIKVEYVNGKKVTTKTVSGVVVERTVEDIPAKKEDTETPKGENSDDSKRDGKTDNADGKDNDSDSTDDSGSSETSSAAIISSSLWSFGVLLCIL